MSSVVRKIIHSSQLKFLAVTVLPCCSTLYAQDNTDVANYAYSVFVGTGKYSIEDRTIYIFRAPLAFELDPIDYDAGDKLGFKLLLPAAIGVTDFKEDEQPDVTIDDFQTISVVPGVEVPIALTSDWQVNPFAQVGFGVDTKSSSESFIWGAGVRSSVMLGESSNWLLGGEYLWAGNNPNGDASITSFSRLGVGVEYKIPTSWTIAGRKISWHTRLIQWHFTDAADFSVPDANVKLHNATEVGVSIGIDPPINLLGYQLRQGGIGYETANNYQAIILFTTFPF